MIFETIDEMWIDVINRVCDVEPIQSRVGPCREILHYSATLTDVSFNIIWNPVRNFCFPYAHAELLWYLSGSNDTSMLQSYAPSYKNFTEDGVYASGAYGHRWRHDINFDYQLRRDGESLGLPLSKFFENGKLEPPITQIQSAAWLLKKSPETRQCVITCWNASDLIRAITGKYKDIPCTLTIGLIIRNNKLHMMVTMRSNDIWLGMPYDIFCFTSIQKLIAESIGIECGQYTHSVMSIHLYEKNREKALIARHEQFNVKGVVYRPHRMRLSDAVKESITLERVNRETKAVNNGCADIGEGSLIHQCLAIAAFHFSKNKRTLSHIEDPIGKHLQETFNVRY